MFLHLSLTRSIFARQSNAFFGLVRFPSAFLTNYLHLLNMSKLRDFSAHTLEGNWVEDRSTAPPLRGAVPDYGAKAEPLDSAAAASSPPVWAADRPLQDSESLTQLRSLTSLRGAAARR